MQLEWLDSQDGVDWHALSYLYKIAPLGEKSAADLETVFSNSRYKCFVRRAGKVIGVGRVLADGIDCAYICDVAVHPEFQGQGIGGEIISRLVELSRGHRKIILYANPGKQGFYARLGFKRMNTAMAIFADQKFAVDIGLLSDD